VSAGRKVVDAMMLLDEVIARRDHGHARRHHALNVRHELGVEAKLENRSSARLGSQLGVGHLVAEVAQLARRFDAHQKVRAAHPTFVL